MKIRHIANIFKGQDGAIWGNYIFRFTARGECRVYNMNDIDSSEIKTLPEIAVFNLDRAEEIVPHSNSVMFGNEYYSPDDEFPLLYSNIYNNYAKTETPLKGTCLVYRVQRDGEKFLTTLVQMIEVGFTEDDIWKSCESDVRPYGNFTIDRKNGIYYGFVMRDADEKTRYFAFDLPKISDGTVDEKYNIKKVVLEKKDIKDCFDCEYHRYLQGACYNEGKIYSVEGFSNNSENPPVLRIIDVNEKKQIFSVDFTEYGLAVEAEFIDFKDGVCYYSDAHGKLFIIE